MSKSTMDSRYARNVARDVKKDSSVSCVVKRAVKDDYSAFCRSHGVSINVWTKALVLITVGRLSVDQLDLPAEELALLVRGL